MVLLADGHWHKFQDLYRQGVEALTLIELRSAKLAEFNKTSARLTEKGMSFFDRVVDRMLLAVPKEYETRGTRTR